MEEIASKVDKEVCLEVLKRGLKTGQNPELFKPIRDAVHNGPAEDWKESNQANFQKFAKKHGIQPKTPILIWKKGASAFVVTKK